MPGVRGIINIVVVPNAGAGGASRGGCDDVPPAGGPVNGAGTGSMSSSRGCSDGDGGGRELPAAGAPWGPTTVFSSRSRTRCWRRASSSARAIAPGEPARPPRCGAGARPMKVERFFNPGGLNSGSDSPRFFCSEPSVASSPRGGTEDPARGRSDICRILYHRPPLVSLVHVSAPRPSSLRVSTWTPARGGRARDR